MKHVSQSNITMYPLITELYLTEKHVPFECQI